MSKRLDRFAEAARELIGWCESTSATSSDREDLRALLARVYGLALTLRMPDAPSLDVERAGCSEAEWQAVYQRCSTLPFNYYSEMFDPLRVPAEEDPVVGDLADDVAVIHRDLVSGESLYAAGHHTEAEFEWRFSFDSHWGRHASSAQRVLHCWFERNSGS